MTGQGLESRSLASMIRPVWTLQYCFAKYHGKKVAPDTQIGNPVKSSVGVSSHILAKTASSSLLFLGCGSQCNSYLHCLGPSIQTLVPFLVTSFCCSFFLRVIFSSSPFFSFISFSSMETCPYLNWQFWFSQKSHFEG